MIVQRFFDDKLAQASYLIGCAATGEALVVDANRDVEQFIRAAESEGVRITHVTETHIHADYVSGSRELARRTGSRLYLSAEGGEDWQYAFAGPAGAVLVRDGDEFQVGNIRIEVVHTPGHTPEHVSFLVTDRAAADRPIAVLTGDFVFAGDVGRPDLLEKAAGVSGTMEAGARTLFGSLARFKKLPDYLQIWPGHGAGSACGKSLSAVPTTTVGYERLFNWAFQIEDEDDFIRQVLEGQPEPPRYFAEMKRINKEGPRLLGGFRRPERLPAGRLAGILAGGGLIVDTRPAAEFAAGHLPKTINIPLDRAFTTWAGWLVPYTGDFHLLADDKCNHCIDEAVRDLAMIGLDRIAGYFGKEAIDSWSAAGGEVQTVPQIGVEEVAEELSEGATVVDVRGAVEWESGHIPGAVHIPLGELAGRAGELPRGRPVVVHCQTGARAAIGTSVLQANGFEEVANFTGGFAAWESAGRPVAEAGDRTATSRA
jgi:hydroxyacylglutathione hydrolase